MYSIVCRYLVSWHLLLQCINNTHIDADFSSNLISTLLKNLIAESQVLNHDGNHQHLSLGTLKRSVLNRIKIEMTVIKVIQEYINKSKEMKQNEVQATVSQKKRLAMGLKLEKIEALKKQFSSLLFEEAIIDNQVPCLKFTRVLKFKHNEVVQQVSKRVMDLLVSCNN